MEKIPRFGTPPLTYDEHYQHPLTAKIYGKNMFGIGVLLITIALAFLVVVYCMFGAMKFGTTTWTDATHYTATVTVNATVFSKETQLLFILVFACVISGMIFVALGAMTSSMAERRLFNKKSFKQILMERWSKRK